MTKKNKDKLASVYSKERLDAYRDDGKSWDKAIYDKDRNIRLIAYRTLGDQWELATGDPDNDIRLEAYEHGFWEKGFKDPIVSIRAQAYGKMKAWTTAGIKDEDAGLRAYAQTFVK